MENAQPFRDKIGQGRVCLGTAISFTDPTVTEALCKALDFVWIDMEHAPLSLEVVQAHILATKGSDVTPLVRVPWNDLVAIKQVLDMGAAGVIVPMVNTADEARRAVAACRYPPEGIRGYGPRRTVNYGRENGPDYARAANEQVIAIVQVEHIDAVAHLDEILRTPGLDGILIGPSDLAASMGHVGQPGHPAVSSVIETIVVKAHRYGVWAGIALGDDPVQIVQWIRKGMQWVAVSGDFWLLVRAADQITATIRAELEDGARGAS